MLTKEECVKALEQLDLNCWGCEYACDMSDDKPCVLKEIIGKLIDEHFDNPALHLDELKIGMWVYDATINKYRRIVNIQENKLYFEGQKLGVNFKENKFYRKLVE